MTSSKKVFLCIIVLAGLFYTTSKIRKSNSANIDTYGADREDVAAIKKLNELIEENFLNRSYYEVFAGSHWVANYNKEHQVLLISGSPSSGWSYFFYATPKELKMISDKKLAAADLHHFLRAFPADQLGELPTRSRDLISIF